MSLPKLLKLPSCEKVKFSFQKKFFTFLSLLMVSIIGFCNTNKFFFHKDNKEKIFPKEEAVDSFFRLGFLKKCNPQKKEKVSSLFLPAPLNHPSAKELSDFPGCTVLEYAETSGPSPNTLLRCRVLKTTFQYPYIRTEELIDAESHALLSRQEMVADHLVVMAKQKGDLASLIKSLHLQQDSVTTIASELGIYLLPLSNYHLDSFSSVLAVFKKNHLGVVAEPDFLGRLQDIPDNHAKVLEMFNNPVFKNQQWGLWSEHIQNNDNDHIYHGINAPQGWLVQNSADPIIVAVVDTGINYNHPDLQANMWHNPRPTRGDIYGINFADSNGDPMDHNGHGTMCAGIIGGVGGTNNVVGVCWNVQLMACKCSEDEIMTVAGLYGVLCYAVNHGAKVINCSLGNWGNELAGWSIIEYWILEWAAAHGVIVVCAAGNDGLNSDTFFGKCYPASFSSSNIVSVASLSEDDQLSFFSNYGKATVDLAAPGEGIISTGLNDGYNIGSGTSVATPFVTGAVALLCAKYPDASYKIIINHLLETTYKLPQLKEKVKSGGVLDLGKALTTPLNDKDKKP